MKLTQKEINALELHGNKIITMATTTLWSNPDKLHIQAPSGFQSFVSWLFEKDS